MTPSPYVGPRPFTSDDAATFRGRDREARDLTALIQAHPVVLIYAPSGAGKTSLLNARVTPALEASNCHVLPIARVGGDTRKVDQGSGLNVFVANVVDSVSAASPLPELLDPSLQSFLLRVDAEQNREQILPKLTVLIIDQFEELFTKHVDAWEQRQRFFEDLSEALSSERRLRVVLAMREEYLAALDPYRELLPGALDIRFRLPLLDSEAALQAITEPARDAGVPFDPGVAEGLVKSLRQITQQKGERADLYTEHVEPLQLQVVCRTIWEFLPESSSHISESDVKSLGNVEDALRAYYDETVRMLMEDLAQRKSSTQEGAVRNWFEEHFILADGTRALTYVRRSSGDKPNILELIVDKFDKRHLVRPEVRAGKTWHELSHDRFVQPIQRSNKEFRDRGSGGMGSLLDHIARDYADSHRAELLLAEPQLKEASAWIESLKAEGIPPSPLIINLLEKSRSNLVEKTHRDELSRKRLENEQQQMALEQERKFNIELNESRNKLKVGIRVMWGLVAALAALGFTTYLIYADREREMIVQSSTERADFANRLIEDPMTRTLGLAYAVLAVKPSIDRDLETPPAAVSALTDATNAIGGDVLTENPVGVVKSVSFADDGKQLMIVGDRGVLVADAQSGRTIARRISDPHQEFLRAELLGPSNLLYTEWERKFESNLIDEVDEHTQIYAYGRNSRARQLESLDTMDRIDWVSQRFEPGEDCCKFTPDGSHALIWTNDSARTVSVRDGRSQRRFPDQASFDEIGEFSLVGGGRYVALDRGDQTLRLWDLNTGASVEPLLTPPRQFANRRKQYSPYVFSASGQYAALLNRDSIQNNTLVAIWKIGVNRPVTIVKIDRVLNDFVFLAEEDRALAVRVVQGSLDSLIINALDGSYEPFVNREGVQFHYPTPNYLATALPADDGQVLSIWDPQSRRELVSVQLHRGGISKLALSPNAESLALVRSPNVSLQSLRPRSSASGDDASALITRACRQLQFQLEFQRVSKECRVMSEAANAKI